MIEAKEIEGLVRELPAAEAFARLEHRFGVLPLLEAFFAPSPEVEKAAACRGALGLFTPTPEPGWGTAVEGELTAEGAVLRGEVRLPACDFDGALVLADFAGGERRLAWVAARPGAPGWLVLREVEVGSGLISRPLTLPELLRRIEEYAGVWALAAAVVAHEGVRALRRAARTTVRQGAPFSSSQWVALGIAEVEIEAELALSAARRNLASEPRSGDLATAVAAAGILAAVAARTAELRDQAGLEELDGPLAGPMGGLSAFLGGPLALQNELARSLGIGAEAAA